MRAAGQEIALAQRVGAELRVEADGSIWRVGRRINGQLTPISPRRAESQTKDGYLRVAVVVAGKKTRALAHRVVWVVANGAIPDGLEINHRDGDKRNNRLENLELVTPSENVRHSLAVLGRQRARGERHPHALLDEQTVRAMRAAHEAGESCREIAARYGRAKCTVTQIVARKAWRHVQ